MGISTRVTVGTTATLLASQIGHIRDEQVRLKNTGAATVFLGSSDVTTSTGFDLTAGEEPAEYTLEAGDTLYGIVVTGTCIVEVMTI